MAKSPHVYISADLEGITGVFGREQAASSGRNYERARRAMTADVNAAVAGALAAGAGLIVVTDGHGSKDNLILEELNPAAEVVLGSPRPLTQMEGISADFDVALLIGYHSRMGSPGVLSHTISGGVVANIWVNGRLAGEIGINAVLAGSFGVPVGLVTGDQYTCAEAREFIGDVRTVEVKQAITRYAARCLHPQRSEALIREAARETVAGLGELKPLSTEPPYTFRLQCQNTGMAESAARVPGAVVINPTTLEVADDDAAAAFAALRAMIGLARS